MTHISLEYASSNETKRRRPKPDTEIAWMSLVQIIAWSFAVYSYASSWGPRPNYSGLFGLAWAYNYSGLIDSAMGVVTSLCLLITSFRHSATRLSWYRAYVGVITTTLILHWIAQRYLDSQCQGAWSTLLYPGGASAPLYGLLLVFHPVFWSLLIRALVPTKWNRVSLQLYNLLLLAGLVFAFSLAIGLYLKY